MTSQYTLSVLLFGCACAFLAGLFIRSELAFRALPSPWHIVSEDEVRVGNYVAGFEDIHTSLAATTHQVWDNEPEALNTLAAAVQLCRAGRRGKAARLFEHALALSPRQPDVLTVYGEFLEHSCGSAAGVGDVVAADQLYQRAVAVSPHHRRASSNRRRTSPLVEQADLRQLRRVDDKRRRLASVGEDAATTAALRRVKREAYFQQIHHSSGIEGNTMTLAETRFVVETRAAVAGRSVAEHNEVLGLDEAIKFINSSLVRRLGAIRLHDILEIHRRVMGRVDPLEAGNMRTTQVFVGRHRPPHPARLPALMSAFVEWLNDPDTLGSLHPIKFAALAHYKLVYIHPFSDGNGRTSRLLMNLIMMQAGYPPVIVRRQDRHFYYRCLQAANDGDVRPFVRFIADCAEKTLDVYLWATARRLHSSAHQLHDDDEQLAFVRGQYDAPSHVARQQREQRRDSPQQHAPSSSRDDSVCENEGDHSLLAGEHDGVQEAGPDYFTSQQEEQSWHVIHVQQRAFSHQAPPPSVQHFDGHRVSSECDSEETSVDDHLGSQRSELHLAATDNPGACSSADSVHWSRDQHVPDRLSSSVHADHAQLPVVSDDGELIDR